MPHALMRIGLVSILIIGKVFCQEVFINEFHYDNSGADVNEFVEVAGTAGTNLAQYELIF